MKTKEELYAIKEKVETLNKKLAELTEDELAQVSGGRSMPGDEPDDEPGDPGLEPVLEPVNTALEPWVRENPVVSERPD